MCNRLSGKVAIVTGGGNGIGKAVCQAFAAEGADLVVSDIQLRAAKSVVAEIAKAGRNALEVETDVRSKAAVQALVKSTLDRFGTIDILVNIAGIRRDMPVFKMTEKDWDDVVDTSLKGTFTTTQAVTDWMIPRAKKAREEGRPPPVRKIINITSGAVRGNPGQASYSAAKAGIIGLTRSNAKEFGRHNILVNVVSPLALTSFTEDRPDYYAQATILGRIGDPLKDIAPVFVFLASDESNYVTGQVIGVNGGLDTQY